MPTEEQIRQIEDYLQKVHYRWKPKKLKSDGYKQHDWMPIKPQIQEALFCSKCSGILTRVFGGHSIYIYSAGRRRKIELNADACERMMILGKTMEEISSELGLSMLQVSNLAVKIKKEKEKWDKLKKLEIPSKHPIG